jgi:hypothetical protein
MLHVTIPKHDTDSFILYAAGKVLVETHDTQSHHFVFYTESTVILFYYLPHFRKAYMVCDNQRAPLLPPRFLPNVREPVAVIASFTARKFDRLKNSVYYLEMNHPEFAALPVSFFYRLAALIEDGKHAHPYIDVLIERERNKNVSFAY